MGDLEFLVLGPLEVRRDGSPVRIRGNRERAILAMLLLADGSVVTVDRLAEAVWDDAPPPTAVKTVRNCVSALRQSLAKAGRPANSIESATLGYRMRLAGCRLDAREFRCQTEAARKLAATGQIAEAADGLRGALCLWRGPAVAGIRGRLVEAGAARLDEQRMTVLEECLDLELALGRHRQVVSELSGLTAEYPLRERIAGQLMLALYRSGRQAEALGAFTRLAARLVDDLGIDPAVELTRLHEAILRQDPSLACPAEQPDTVPRRAQSSLTLPRPAQLPLDVPCFTGRSAELARLRALVPPAGDPHGETMAVVITAIAGTAGIGKTALALRFAHQVADRYPDGQLYINLRGFDPSGSPVAAGEALRRFLIALGVAAQAIPAETADQEALYRSLLAGKRVLIVLDNAVDATTVRPLLPGSSGCLVLVTSRNQLTGLVAAEGAVPLTIGALSDEEARDLIASRLGADRLGAGSAVTELVSLCGGLPLALVIMAARAAASPGLALADLVAELRTTRSRLDVLGTGDPGTDVRTVFSWSYRQLDEQAARMFRLLGIHPGPDITATAVANLAAVRSHEARVLLAGLARSNLIMEHAPGRYSLHDLLRAYATDLADASGAAEEQRDSQRRLLDYYLSAAAAAMDMLHPAEAHRRPRVPPAQIREPGITDQHAALAWLEAERTCLVAVTANAAASGWPAHAVRLSATLERYLQGGHYPEGLTIHGHARDAARRAGDHEGEASSLRALGVLYWMLGSREEAADHTRRALTLYRRCGNQVGQARCLSNLGALEADQGVYAQCVELQEQSLALFSAAGDRPGECVALTNLADMLLRVGRDGEASAHLRRALALSRQDGDRHGEAHALQTLGEVEQHSGQLDRAAEHYGQALAVFTELGNRRGQAWIEAALGTICNHRGHPGQAANHHRQAIAFSREGHDRDGQAVALNGLGEAVYAAGRPVEALAHHVAALALAYETGNLVQQARARVGLGHCHDALGQPGAAQEHFWHAFELYNGLGYPEAEKIGARLARDSERSKATP